MTEATPEPVTAPTRDAPARPPRRRPKAVAYSTADREPTPAKAPRDLVAEQHWDPRIWRDEV